MTKTILVVGMPTIHQKIVIDRLRELGYTVVHENINDQIKGLEGKVIQTGLVELPAYVRHDRKSKGEKKRQRSEWKYSQYNNRKGLSRG